MFALGGLLCAILGALEDAFGWAAGKIRREEAAPAAGEKE
jgi:hypothetical protein